MSADVLASLNVCHNCFQCCIRCQFSVVFIVTLSHHRRIVTTVSATLPRFTGFTQQLAHVLSIFYPNCDILSGFLSLLLQSLTPAVLPFVCLHYYYHYCRGRSLHPCLHCFRRCIVVCIIAAMLSLPCCHCLCHALLRFH